MWLLTVGSGTDFPFPPRSNTCYSGPTARCGKSLLEITTNCTKRLFDSGSRPLVACEEQVFRAAGAMLVLFRRHLHQVRGSPMSKITQKHPSISD